MMILQQRRGTGSEITITPPGRQQTVRMIAINNGSTTPSSVSVYIPFRNEASSAANAIIGPVSLGNSRISVGFDPPLVLTPDQPIRFTGSTNCNCTIYGD